ncbi:MFS transporter [Psychromarinibacter sp. C21-152]|uniref:MFS transporter n=1 Tax=Psychromarinibacter sediminicola TaxID=3033385 RepID=A0AAE3NT27_9RHOB|nr:MFS transporter [Psychromarinibacter sediminicola]MDF0601501.1 MFS transporter [Psychromarinibacter sediminicola]
MARPTGPYLFILATLMIDAIGIGIVFPIMPDLMERVGAHDSAEGSVWAGVLMAAYAGAQFVFGPIVGSISDAWGRKPVLLAALVFLALDYVLMALAGTFWLLLLGRTLAGLAGATYITATAYISDITPREQRAARFGMIGAAFGIGFVLGPALGGIVAAWHVTAPFWLAAAMAAVNVAFGLFVLPESLKPEHRRPFGARDLNPFASFLRAWAMPGMAIPLVCIGLFEFANMVYPTLWAFWGRETFGWSALVIGLSLSAYGVLVALVQAVAMPVAVERLRERRLVLWGLAVAVVSLVGFGFTTAVWAVVLFLPLASLSDLVPPTLTALAANAADEDRQGMVQGVIASLSSLAAVAGPLVFTPVFSVFVAPDAAVRMPGAPFLLSAVLVAAILPLAWRLARAAPQSVA